MMGCGPREHDCRGLGFCGLVCTGWCWTLFVAGFAWPGLCTPTGWQNKTALAPLGSLRVRRAEYVKYWPTEGAVQYLPCRKIDLEFKTTFETSPKAGTAASISLVTASQILVSELLS